MSAPVTGALDSVRQLADRTGAVTLAQRYDPFGDALSSAGSGASVFGFAGEQTDATGLEYLRARYYAPRQERVISKDTCDTVPVETFFASVDGFYHLGLFSYL